MKAAGKRRGGERSGGKGEPAGKMGCGECTPGWETLRSRKVMLDKELSEGRSLQSSVGKYNYVKRLLWCQGVIQSGGL